MLKTNLFPLLFLLFFSPFATAQNGAHSMDINADLPLLGAGVLTFGFGMELQHNTPILTEEQLQQVDPFRINRLDRLACTQLNPWAAPASDWTLRATAIAPLGLMLIDKKTRSEAGIVTVMLAESLLINNGIKGIFKGGIQRSRPLIYNPNCDLMLKQARNARFSFFSGHASNSANFAFLAAQVFTNNNPDSKLKPYVWGAAVVLPAITGYFRFKAGKHFPTDIIVGYAVGASVGYLVPELHKR